ncbi:hypothetical protein B0H19DRAFT_383923 [Mycena capillaripes]|nr:hypothetical protein B0H19DRAFT_383923 [Mycena capillaripes]
MVPSCLPVQELWDHVVDQLQWRKKDLKSCSLVCRALVPRAQSYIFCDIYLSFHSGSNVTRLAHLLASSPHLIAYIRHLSLRECEAGTMNSLDGIPWSRLETLTIMRHDMNFTSDRKFADNPPAFEQLYTLVGLPSLRRLNIYGPFWRVPYLFPILDHCTSALERLEFENCNLRASFEPVVTRLAKKPKIRHLRLDQSSVGEVLMDPAFPLDVSSLTYVQLRCQIMPRSELAVILRSRSSIHTLDFLQISGTCFFFVLQRNAHVRQSIWEKKISPPSISASSPPYAASSSISSARNSPEGRSIRTPKCSPASRRITQ